MNGSLVSVIVPAYQVEPFFEECLASLSVQTLKNIEIVIIDDGSTDRTADIAHAYASRDSRFRVYRQDHKGVSAARNLGLSKATGEYIGFVDSDDWVSADAFERLYERAITFQADIVLGTITYCYEDGRRCKLGNTGQLFAGDEVPDGQGCMAELMRMGCYLPMLCTNLYRNGLVRKHSLVFEAAYHEDEFFHPRALFFAERVIDYKDDFYYYRQREQSIMHSDNILIRAESLVYVCNSFFSFVQQNLSGSNALSCFQLLCRGLLLYRKSLSLYSRLPGRLLVNGFDCQRLHELAPHFDKIFANQLYIRYFDVLKGLRRFDIQGCVD